MRTFLRIIVTLICLPGFCAILFSSWRHGDVNGTLAFAMVKLCLLFSGGISLFIIWVCPFRCTFFKNPPL
jgi:hypothetical protein